MSTSRETASHLTLNPGRAGLVFWKQRHMWAVPYSSGRVGDSVPVPKRFHLIRSLEPAHHEWHIMEALAVACCSSEVSLQEDCESSLVQSVVERQWRTSAALMPASAL